MSEETPAPASEPTLAGAPATPVEPVAARSDAPSPVEEKSPAEKVYPEAEKPAEAAKPGEEKPAEEKPEAPALKLEDYDIKLPENFVLDDTTLGSFKELALAAKLPPAEAQKFADLHATVMQNQLSQLQAQNEKLRGEWLQASLALPEFSEANRERSSQVVARFVEEYGSPEVKTILNESGLGNHPAIVKMLYDAAEALVEGEPMPAGGVRVQGAKPRTAGEMFYPSMDNARTQ